MRKYVICIQCRELEQIIKLLLTDGLKINATEQSYNIEVREETIVPNSSMENNQRNECEVLDTESEMEVFEIVPVGTKEDSQI